MERLYTAEECKAKIKKFKIDIDIWNTLIASMEDGSFAFIDETKGPRFWIVEAGMPTTSMNTGRFVTLEEANLKADEAAKSLYLWEKLSEVIEGGTMIIYDDESITFRLVKSPLAIKH